jgi:hypothetical protein
MPIVISKQQNGTLTFGTTPGTDFSCQPTAVKIATSTTSDDGVETLCGDKSPDEITFDSTLDFTVIQDWSDDAGLIAYSHEHKGEVVDFSWAPNGATGPTWTGTVQVIPLDIGGDVAARLTSDGSWPIVSLAAPTYPALAAASA